MRSTPTKQQPPCALLSVRTPSPQSILLYCCCLVWFGSFNRFYFLMNKDIEEERIMCETLSIRPIDEALARLHKPVIATDFDDIDSALDGFRVTSSGSIMVPSGSTKPLMVQRSLSTISSASSVGSKGGSGAAQTAAAANAGAVSGVGVAMDQYYQTSVTMQQQQQQHYYQQYPSNTIHGSLPTRYSTSVPTQAPPPPTTFPGSLPGSLPRSLPRHSYTSGSVPKSLPPPTSYYPSYPSLQQQHQQQPMHHMMVGSPMSHHMVGSPSPTVMNGVGGSSMPYPYPPQYYPPGSYGSSYGY